MSGKNIKGLALLPVLNHKRGGVSKTNENEAWYDARVLDVYNCQRRGHINYLPL